MKKKELVLHLRQYLQYISPRLNFLWQYLNNFAIHQKLYAAQFFVVYIQYFLNMKPN